MPRGSKPGERRGGRQRGTPNKSTVLKNAAITAAASDPNLSPLDFLLNLMRQRDLPVEYRVSVAHQALPFAHAKPVVPGRNYNFRPGKPLQASTQSDCGAVAQPSDSTPWIYVLAERCG